MDNTFRVGAVISRGFKIYFRNFFSFTLLMLVVYSPLILAAYMMIESTLTDESIALLALGMGLGSMILGVVASAAVTHGTFEQLRGRRASLGSTVAVGLKRLVPVLLTAFVMALGIVLGFIALVIPGMILVCRWWVAIPVAVVEKPGIMASLGRSAELTKGHRWQIFGAIFLLGLINNFCSRLLKVAFLNDHPTMTDVRMYLFGVLAVTVFIAGITAVIACVGYHDLRQSKEGMDTEELASVFD